MDPVLIYTDTVRITKEKNTLNKVVNLFQSVFDAFAAINIPVTIQEISNLVHWTLSDQRTDFVQIFATNKVVDAAGPLTIGGILLSREKFMSLMDSEPNVTGVKTALRAVGNTFGDSNEVRAARIDLLSLTGSTIAKVSDSDAQITALFTYYTASDAGAQLATDLLVICGALNDYNTARPKTWGVQQNTDFAVPGTQYRNGSFALSLGYIRHFEQSGQYN
ncbi:MAG: hypothetical protein M3O71_02540 [Bacteroidota bacterium]|nr:hypothetical protein [Bacteroidota bacterium]